MDRQPGRMHGYRPIAPRQADLQNEQMPAPLGPEEVKTKRASMACLECKKRRTKCSTGNPCSECATHQRECIYDQSADKRRKEHALTTKNQLQNTQESLNYYHKLFEDLLDSIRYADEAQLQQLVNAVRATTRKPVPDTEDRSAYDGITDIVYAVLEELEDAEGSEASLYPEDIS